jgi:peptide/nickel transport system permease protein
VTAENRRQWWNGELLAGGLLLCLLVLVAAFGPRLAPFPPDYSESVRRVAMGGETELIFAPEAPNPRHPLGTDMWGYDLLTLLLYGARYTLLACFAVALLRLALGLVFGMAAGLRRPPTRRLESLGGIPAFVLLIFIFHGLTVNSSLPVARLFSFQVACIALVGLPGVIIPIQSRTYRLSQAGYIEAARSVGVGNLRILRCHIFPHLREDFLSLFVTELIHALNLIGQLGIFFIFLGGTILTESPPLLHSVTHEWAGLVGQLRTKISSDPWLLFVPLSAYVVVLMSFQLISQGLDKHYEKKYAKTPFV